MVPSTCEEEKLPLAIKNCHPKDNAIAFDEQPHVYYIKGKVGYTSATTFIHGHFGEFDGPNIAKNMIENETFPNGRYKKYRGMTVDEKGKKVSDDILVDRILESWAANSKLQSGLGTIMHRNIELFYNDMYDDTQEMTKEFSLFLKYHEKVKQRRWVPLRTEMMIWDPDAMLCGSIDMLYIDESLDQDIEAWKRGEATLRVNMVDWKRSKEIKRFPFGNKYGKYPCHQVMDCNYFHYKLQLNLYKWMLEKSYNIQVDSMAILVCHPNNDKYIKYTMTDEQELIQKMVNQRMDSFKT